MSPCERIAIVTETYVPEVNGVASTLARLVSGLAARGHPVSVVRPRQPHEAERNRPSELASGSSLEMLVTGVAIPRYPGLQLGLSATRRLRRRWTAERPDVVYVATPGPLGWSAVRATRRLQIPVVSGFHTNFDAYATHYGPSAFVPIATAYLKRFHNGTDATLVPTTDMRDRLVAAGFANVSVLGRGVDVGLFSPARRSAALRSSWGVGDGDLVVLYVGRIAAEKNIGLAIQAYRAMQAARAGLRFVLVGDGPLRPVLEAANPDLRFAGIRRDEPLAAHYASADIFLFPSETETYGNVVPEAMASGLAVVAYAAAAARLHITPGQNGVIVPGGDTRAFVSAAAALARSPEAVGVMRARAPGAVTALDWDRVVDRFAQLLRAACASEHRPRRRSLVTRRATT